MKDLVKPELKQFGDLSPADFDHHPVWVGCHTGDYGEPWYEGTDEETFRPWTGALPVSQSDGIFLVRATLELQDGSRHPGFVTPAFKKGDLGVQQPQIFVGKRHFRFWGGMFGVAAEERQALYTALGRGPDAVFPLRFNVDPSLSSGATAGRVDGFYRGFSRDVQVEY